jgi:heat shock protein HtpX
MGLFNIIILLTFAAMLTIRFAGPAAFAAILMPSIAFMITVFMLGEVIVNFVFGAERPHPEHDRRFIESMQRVKRKSNMWVTPRAWIVPIGQPNAMAYGPGIPGLCAVGISRELIELLTDDELDGVIGHEFAHIKCRDTGILAVIGLVLSMINKLRKLLSNKNSLIVQSPITYLIGWVIYAIGRTAFYISQFSISQERELAADALSAYYNNDPKPLISALRKLHAWGKKHKPKEKESEPFLKDLMVAHPGLEERIASLENLIQQEVLLITVQTEEQ